MPKWRSDSESSMIIAKKSSTPTIDSSNKIYMEEKMPGIDLSWRMSKIPVG